MPFWDAVPDDGDHDDDANENDDFDVASLTDFKFISHFYWNMKICKHFCECIIYTAIIKAQRESNRFPGLYAKPVDAVTRRNRINIYLLKREKAASQKSTIFSNRMFAVWNIFSLSFFGSFGAKRNQIDCCTGIVIVMTIVMKQHCIDKILFVFFPFRPLCSKMSSAYDFISLLLVNRAPPCHR